MTNAKRTMTMMAMAIHDDGTIPEQQRTAGTDEQPARRDVVDEGMNAGSPPTDSAA